MDQKKNFLSRKAYFEKKALKEFLNLNSNKCVKPVVFVMNWSNVLKCRSVWLKRTAARDW